MRYVYKGLISIIYKHFIYLNIIKKNHPIKKKIGQKAQTYVFSKDDIQMANEGIKIPTLSLENAKSKLNEVSPTSQNCHQEIYQYFWKE